MSLEPQVIGALVAAISSVVVALISKFYGSAASRGAELTLANERTIPMEQPTDPLEPALARLQEARDMLRRQQAVAQSNRWISGSLTIGQYIIGGLLASSFVQQALPSYTVGILGLLVLVSSLLFQHFRPDVRLRGALTRSLHLKSLIRAAEDDIQAMRANQPNTPTVYDLQRRISDGLSRIEASELDEIPVASATKP